MSIPTGATPPRFSMRHRVEFSDTDMAGIVHFSRFFRYMEVTEHAFLRSLGLSVHMESDGRTIGWPRVHAEMDYRRPLRFEDEFDVDLFVREARERKVIYDFAFRREGDTEAVATGSVTVVCVAIDPSTGAMQAVPIPPEVAIRLGGSR